MAERFLQKVPATTNVLSKPTAAGVGVVSGNVYVNDGTDVRALARLITSGLLRVAAGQATTVAASDTIVTGLSTVVLAIASLDSDPVDDPFMVTASIGDQAGSPAAGSILIKTWKNTGGTDPTPAAATTFSKKVNWIAIGT